MKKKRWNREERHVAVVVVVDVAVVVVVVHVAIFVSTFIDIVPSV